MRGACGAVKRRFARLRCCFAALRCACGAVEKMEDVEKVEKVSL